jgi:hypothetical protein
MSQVQAHVERILEPGVITCNCWRVSETLSKPMQSYVEKRIGEVSSTDRIVRINAKVFKTNPFIIDDGSGKALVKSPCVFKESDKIRVTGHVFFKKNGNMPEIEPIAIQDMNKFDYSLYDEMQKIRRKLAAKERDGK